MKDNTNPLDAIPEEKKRRGFAAMSPERQRQVASMGGRRAHENGTAYRWTSEGARAAAVKAQQSRRAKRSTGVA